MPGASRDTSRQARILRSLPFRVVIFLALALLPIGLLAIWQTRDLAVQARTRTNLNILALTALASSDERQAYERAFGAAEALSSVLRLLKDDPAACSQFLANYQSESRRYTFVGILPPDRLMTCSSAPGPLDLSDDPDAFDLFGDPRPAIVRVDDPAASTEPILSVFQPLYENDAFVGYVTMSIPRDALTRSGSVLSDPDQLTVITFSADGEILTTESGEGDVTQALPTVPLADLVSESRYTFEAPGRDETQHIYGVIPLVDNTVYALSAWPADNVVSQSLRKAITSATFPLAMWLASLLVAYFAVHRLVVGQVRTLSAKMRRFARNRELPVSESNGAASAEFAELEETFMRMSYDLIEDEAKMEDALREKNVLLKEVHHRVKNNLQMISSIMNMQFRNSKSDETRAILQRLQDRVLGLAAVHRHLYQAEDLAKTDTGALLEEVANNQFSAVKSDDIFVETEFESITMFPDQALPLSLLVTEMSTNAIKYVTAPEGEARRIRLSLTRQPDNSVELRCENTRDPDAPAIADAAIGTGLGNQLIRAFALQLGATPVVKETDTSFTISVNFAVAEFKPAPLDY